MSVIGKYLSRQQPFTQNIEAPGRGLKMVVVIPCFMEPDITTTLLSLWENHKVPCWVEVVVVVNSSELATPEQVAFNRSTFDQLQKFAHENNKANLKLLPLLIEGARRKHAGVGLARKTGMDLALSRFEQVGEPNGILISLDADSVVSPNYLHEIFHFYQQQPKAVGANVAFEHQKTTDTSEAVFMATQKYELYLRYFRQALKFADFPYAFHTIGSCFTLSAEAYARVGGMPRKQAGEDFYLLHKLFPMGYFGEINRAAVFPVSRESNRVPFGTRPMVSKILQNNSELTTYSFELFEKVKAFIGQFEKLYAEPTLQLADLFIDKRLEQFLQSSGFDENLARIRQNSASLSAFKKQLFAFFNAFKIIQFLNEADQVSQVETEVLNLLKALEIKPDKTDVPALLHLLKLLDNGGETAASLNKM